MLEQLWSRPTAEINGIFGGYTGPGTKTVIPARATAKLSFRLVPNQEPRKILDGLHRFIAERLPPGLHASLTPAKADRRRSASTSSARPFKRRRERSSRNGASLR